MNLKLSRVQPVQSTLAEGYHPGGAQHHQQRQQQQKQCLEGHQQRCGPRAAAAVPQNYQRGWGRLVVLSLFQIAALHILMVLAIDIGELWLQRYLLRHFPTPTIPVVAEGHPKGAPLQPIAYGSGLARFFLNGILAIRVAYPPVRRSWIPIRRIPPLFPLLRDYDFIVVGAGTAGSVLAARLAGIPGTSVLLLEAGGGAIDGRLSSELLPLGSLLNQNTDHDWRFRTVPQLNSCLGMPGRVSFWPRGKLLGGSAVFNFMIVHKGHPDDYKLWSLCLNDTMWSPSSVGVAFSEIEKVYDSPVDESSATTLFPRGRNGLFPITRKQPLGIIQQRFLDSVEELELGNASDYNSGTRLVGGGPLELNKDPVFGTRVTSYRAFVEPLVSDRQAAGRRAFEAGSVEAAGGFSNKTGLPLRAATLPASSVLHVVPFAHVTRVLLNHVETSEPNVVAVAEGVEFAVIPPSLSVLSAGELEQRPRQVVKSNHEVVLSAGAIGTPHILLHSGIGPEVELRRIFTEQTGGIVTYLEGAGHAKRWPRQFVNVSAVGAHLMDHIFFPTVFAVRESLRSEVLSYSNALTFKALWQYFGPFGGRGMLSSPGCDVQLMVAPDKKTLEKENGGSAAATVTKSLPPVCRHLSGDPALTARVLDLYESLPELQILLYGGVPEIWDMHRTMNVALDTATRYGQAHHWNVNGRDLALFRSLNASSVEERMQALSDVGRKLNILLLLPVLLHPRSSGTLRLRSSNPFDEPLIDPRYLEDPEDVAAILRGIRLVEKVHEAKPWRDVVEEFMRPNCPSRRKKLAEKAPPAHGSNKVLWELEDLPEDQQEICQSVEYGSDAFWEKFIRLFTLTLYHPAGTCRMGITELDDGACVDSKLRVRGVRGLRVGDASVFPVLPSGNTAFPVMMVAAVLARELALELGRTGLVN